MNLDTIQNGNPDSKEDRTEFNVDLRQMIIAIEKVVSMVGITDTNHGKRVGYIAYQIAKQAGFNDTDLQYVFELGMLHDCGVSTSQAHENLVNYFDWQDAHIHCEIGHHLLKDFEPLSKFAIPILHHHTPYKDLATYSLSEHDARMANLVFLADRVDTLAAKHYKVDILLSKQDILRQILEQYVNVYFDPEWVSHYAAVQRKEAFWIGLGDSYVTQYVWEMGLLTHKQALVLPEIRKLSLILSYIVDQKSPFTHKHSLRVAVLASCIAKIYGLSSIQCGKIEIAGLLHDIGKLHIPDSVLEKPDVLNEVERSIMRQHSYETYEILRHIKGLEEIACWAAFHHESLNGDGYPFHLQASEIPLEARIIAVADVFQALLQDRPYRPGLSVDQVLQILGNQVDHGKLDGNIVNLVRQYIDDCYMAALGQDSSCNLINEYMKLSLINSVIA